MPADLTKPVITDQYAAVLQQIRDNALAQAKMFDNETVTGLVAGVIRWNNTNSTFERYDGSTWVAIAAGGGGGGSGGSLSTLTVSSTSKLQGNVTVGGSGTAGYALDVHAANIGLGPISSQPGMNANIRLRRDTGQVGWHVGYHVGQGATDFVLYDAVGAAVRLAVSASGRVSINALPDNNYGLTVPAGAGGGAKIGFLNLGRSGTTDYPMAGFNFRTTATAGSYLRDNSDSVTAIRFAADGFRFLHSPFAAAGSTIAFTERARLASDGQLSLYGSWANSLNGLVVQNDHASAFGSAIKFSHRPSAAGALGVQSYINSEGDGTGSFLRVFLNSGGGLTERMRIARTGFTQFTAWVDEVMRLDSSVNPSLAWSRSGTRLGYAHFNASNQLTINSETAGGSVAIAAAGLVGLSIDNLGNTVAGSGISLSSPGGDFYIPAQTTNPTVTPTPKSGAAAIRVDVVNNILWIHCNSGWRGVVLQP